MKLTETDIERFWLYVPKGEPDACWEWTGGRTPDGYGRLSLNRSPRLAKRISFQIHSGDDPGDKRVYQTCQNPPCVNPAHLVLGAARSNAKRALKAGAFPTSLSFEKASEIRKLFAKGQHNKTEIAKMFGVSTPSIILVVQNKTWVDETYDAAAYQATGKNVQKLTIEDAREVRRLHESEGATFRGLGRQFGVDKALVAKIIRGELWKEPEDRPDLARGTWYDGVKNPDPRQEDIERFWTHVVRGDSDSCWGWQASEVEGRGQFRFAGVTVNAPRMAYQINYGSHPGDQDVGHTCNNPICVNPSHLVLGTTQANMLYAVQQGRKAVKLSWDVVGEIRRLSKESGCTGASLAERFGVTAVFIARIIQNKAWVE